MKTKATIKREIKELTKEELLEYIVAANKVIYKEGYHMGTVATRLKWIT